MADEWWSEADNALLVANMNRTDCRGESSRFCCAYHEGVADGITAKGAAESGEVSPTPNPTEHQFCTCDFDPSYTGGECDTCGKWNPDENPPPWEPDVSYVVVGKYRWRSEGHGMWHADTEHTHRPLTWAALVGYARTNQLAITFADGAPIATPVIDINGNRRLVHYWPEGAAE